MLFHGLNNSIELDVVGYQFPDSPKSGKDNFDYDSNWLVLSICYTDRGVSAKQKDACILSYELLDLYKELCALRDIQTGSYISGFMGPYLRIAALKNEDQYSFAIHFAFDTTDNSWKEWKVCATVTADEYNRLLNELKLLVKKYPPK